MVINGWAVQTPLGILSYPDYFYSDPGSDLQRINAMPQVIKKSEIEQYIGHVCEPTDWFEVTQEQVNEFAECTLDRQFIHIDPEAAAKTPFGGTIAHGF